MRKVAVTGGLASGKTSVCHVLEGLGAYVVDSDKIVHQLLSPNTALGKQIIALLGHDVLTEGRFDRKKIAKKVFSEPEKLRSLEHHLHPAVIDEIKRQFEAVKQTGRYLLFVAEVPLLYESEHEQFYDAVIAVTADPSTAKRRLLSCSSEREEDYEKRVARQLPECEKMARADFIIVNNGSFEELKKQVENIQSFLIRGVPS